MPLEEILDQRALIAFREWNGLYCTCSTSVCQEGASRCMICKKLIHP